MHAKRTRHHHKEHGEQGAKGKAVDAVDGQSVVDHHHV